MSEESIIDQTTFVALKDSVGEDFIVELLEAYFDETPKLLSNLEQALANQDCESFQRAAHSIKSTSNTFGALQFGALARELEMMGREKCLNGAPSKVSVLVSGYAVVRNSLEGLTHGQ